MSSPLQVVVTSSDISTPQTDSGPATGSTKIGTRLTLQSDKERRAAYQAGLRHGAARYFNSPVMEQLSLELTLTRATLQAVSDAAMQRERLILHWQTEARWWQDEYCRISAEYSDFVKAVARLVK